MASSAAPRLPIGLQTISQRVSLVMASLARLTSDLSRFEMLQFLHKEDPGVFFATAAAHTREIVPYLYTPVVGDACTSYHRLISPRQGLFLSLNDRGHIKERLQSWPAKSVAAIVVTDGERILGLGDLGGYNGMGIPVGKLLLYTALGGVDPAVTLPVGLDVGTDNVALRADPLYLGLRAPRLRGPAYYSFVDEFVQGVRSVFGPHCLLQWEDFGNSNAFPLKALYRQVLPSYNDDIEGTAAVVLAGLMAATRVPGVRPLRESTFLFYGAGEAGVGIADLIAHAVSQRSGGELSLEQARARIWLVDTQGLITAARLPVAAAAGAAGSSDPITRHAPPRPLEAHKLPYAHAWAGSGPVPGPDLAAIVHALQPDALIGVSAQAGAFTRAVVEAAAAHRPRPLVFALSNPTSRAECTAEQAYAWSGGAALFASGSPFPTVEFAPGDSRSPGQANNSYIFPAVGLAVVACRIGSLTDASFLAAAEALAGTVEEGDLASGSLFPDLARIRAVSAVVGAAVAAEAYDRGVCGLLPRPADLRAFLADAMWQPPAGDAEWHAPGETRLS